MSTALGGLTETAHEGLSRYLQMDTLCNPRFEFQHAALQELIALRVGNDGVQTGLHHAGEDFVRGLGNVEIRPAGDGRRSGLEERI